MQLRSPPPAHLTYCLNVHAGESLAQVMAAVRDHVLPVRDAVCPGRAFGVGLRLSSQATQELLAAGALPEFRDLLDRNNLYAFTVNGFPYGTFHGTAVRERVYSPDWRTAERRDYTLRIARILAGLMRGGHTGSISTVPGSYGAWIRTPGDVDAMTDNLADTAAGLHALERETGREIHLGLEPEPDCFVESTEACIAFFKNHLCGRGRDRLARELGIRPGDAEALVRRHVGICFDTCHLALQYEDPESGLGALAAAGVRISKIQVSAAIRTAWAPGAAARLAPFCDPVYLHQVKAPGLPGAVSRGDLAEALARPPPYGEEWRIHCHVPLYWTGGDGLQTTADYLTPAFFERARRLGVEHFEIETYTFGVLPPALQSRGINRSIIDEFGWVAGRGLS